MLKKIQDYFIGHHLRKSDDVFEHARTIMMYRFSWMFSFLFPVPLISDIALGYNKLTVVHSIDFLAILAFPFLMRFIRNLNVQLIIFFLMTSFSSWIVFLMVNPMSLEPIGVCWVFFFLVLCALLLRKFMRVLFIAVILSPVIFVLCNISLHGRLTIQYIVQENAQNPPIFLMFVPTFLCIYAIWSHTSTIDKARKTITTQKNEIENKNRDITDSINYARHLQDALLPSVESIRAQFPLSEVYYRPKDIVAGDFYWMEKSGNKIFVAAADCTGHGVPGAMVSVVCSGALTRSVREFGITGTSNILGKTREIVIDTFDRNKGAVNDGMDISLLCFDISSGEISWSGANNPLWITNGKEFTVIKGDKQPVGRGVNATPFTTHSVKAEKGDALYLITDGLADQFGGPEGKKLRYKPIIQFLIEHHHLPPVERMQKLDKMFSNWKGNLEQVDDICILTITV